MTWSSAGLPGRRRSCRPGNHRDRSHRWRGRQQIRVLPLQQRNQNLERAAMRNDGCLQTRHQPSGGTAIIAASAAGFGDTTASGLALCWLPADIVAAFTAG